MEKGNEVSQESKRSKVAIAVKLFMDAYARMRGTKPRLKGFDSEGRAKIRATFRGHGMFGRSRKGYGSAAYNFRNLNAKSDEMLRFNQTGSTQF